MALPAVLFLDTSFVIALSHSNDSYHARAKTLDREMSQQGVGCLLHSGILLEIGDGFSRKERREKGEQLLDHLLNEDGYDIVQATDDLILRGFDLFRSRKDKFWGLTDRISFVIMDEAGITHALTADIHFQQAGFRALLLEP
jgi:predicted nucleic acid-binding protein